MRAYGPVLVVGVVFWIALAWLAVAAHGDPGTADDPPPPVGHVQGPSGTADAATDEAPYP